MLDRNHNNIINSCCPCVGIKQIKLDLASLINHSYTMTDHQDREKELIKDSSLNSSIHVPPPACATLPIQSGSHVRRQTTNTVLCIRPVAFRMNEQTAVNNYYQKGDVRVSSENINSIAQEEFDSLVTMLREECTVDVIVVDDTISPDTPDSIFPNNWISFHDVDEHDHDGIGGHQGFAILYPMFAENRRQERRLDILDLLKGRHMFALSRVLDLSPRERDGKFLEGTGSVILDRTQRKAYCALSPRSDRELIIELCDKINYKAVIFEAFQSVISSSSDKNSSVVSVRKHIYHTNVMMCIAENFAVICLASIDSAVDRRAVVDSLTADGKFILEITEDQVNCFAGNMLEIKGRNNRRYLVMSKTAYASLRADQIAIITSHGCEIKYADIHIIETLGGGSARCMICEVFLPLSSK